VGSHILERLRARGIPTVVLLRSTSSRQFLEPAPLEGGLQAASPVEVRLGSITDPVSLQQAMVGVTHVIHCAGATKAQPLSQFYAINQVGTRNVVEAVNAAQGQVRRLVHISSLAAAGPATAEKPVHEEDRPCPVSEYGKSKLAGEVEVREHCRAEHVIIRPPAVYGPRDAEFLRLFRTVKAHLLPCPPGHQPLSMVFVRDLAAAVVAALEHPAAAHRTYFAAGPDVVTAKAMAQEIAAALGTWTLPLPLPLAFLWLVCWLQEMKSRWSGQANVLSLQKYAELRAPGWVCDAGRLRREVGFECTTGLKAGIAETLAWYRQARWM
jgi:dihydroflavonol-4-reductase